MFFLKNSSIVSIQIWSSSWNNLAEHTPRKDGNARIPTIPLKALSD